MAKRRFVLHGPGERKEGEIERDVEKDSPSPLKIRIPARLPSRITDESVEANMGSAAAPTLVNKDKSNSRSRSSSVSDEAMLQEPPSQPPPTLLDVVNENVEGINISKEIRD